MAEPNLKPVPPMPQKPRLKKGESPQSKDFQKRMREFNRAVALREATIEQNKQREREAAAAAERDVLEEAKTQRGKLKVKPVAAKTAEEAVDQGVKEADEDSKRGRRRRRQIDDPVEEAQTGKKVRRDQ